MLDERDAHALLGRLLTVPPADRAAWLDRELPGQPELQARLLGALTNAPDDTTPVTPVSFVVATEPADDTLPGQRLGAFVVDARLPEQGGMGTVYRGHRADGTFTQDVAVKVIARGRDTDALLRRFTLERRILGRLQYPGIVRILDAGATPDGRPYLVMEWVDGVPLDRYCADPEISLMRRLALFQQVCAAVQYAHQHLVVHRDLKPSNVLITADGTPKILDFGLAKLLDENDDSAALVSGTSDRPMTPAYASPEQVRGEAITTATDVYALGMILYEMLTGVRPYRLTSSSPSEIERLICETEPEAPSRAPRGNREPAAPVPPQRLRGDLDAIVLRALEKQPGARYQTAEALSEDVARYLDGRPVFAKRGTIGYRCAKYARRHAKALVTAVAVVAVAAAFVTQNTLNAKRVAAQRDRAEAALRFVVSLFEASDPDRAKGETITAGELLAAGAARLRTELQQQPETRASLLLTIGNTYYKLGRFDAAEPLITEAVALRRSLPGTPPLELADALSALGTVVNTSNDSTRAEAVFTEVLEIRRKVLAADDPLIARSLGNLGIVLSNRGDMPAAEARYRQAYEILHKRNDPAVCVALLALSSALYRQEKYGEALTTARQAWAASRAAYGDENMTTYTAMSATGSALAALEQYDEALQVNRAVVDGLRRMLGDGHFRVAEAWYTFGFMLRRMNRIDEAEAALRAAVAVWRKLPGTLEHRAAWAFSELGGILTVQGRYAEAETNFQEALDRRIRFHGTNHGDVAMAWYDVGDAKYRQGKWAEAEKCFRADLDVLKNLPGTPAIILAYPEEALGRLLSERGRHAEAEPLLRHAFESLKAGLPADNWRVSYAQALIGDSLARQARHLEAEPLLVAGVRGLRGAKHSGEETTYALTRLVALLEASGKVREAAEWRGNIANEDSARR